MPFPPSEGDAFDGRLSLMYWIMMGPHGNSNRANNRAVQRLDFSDCRMGLGVKVIGGYREYTGEEFGIYIKRVVPGGLAHQDGQLRPGDLILEVNRVSLVGVTNDRAVEILRSASATDNMSLVIARDDDSRREFVELMQKYGSRASSGRISPMQMSTCYGKLTDTASSSSSSRSTSPQLVPPYANSPPYATSPLQAAQAQMPIFADSVIQLICVSKGTGLGLVIKGGANHAEGPMVFIQEMVPGGDCQRDGRLMAGDQLVSINKESLIGVTYEEARSIITRSKLRPEPTVEIAFIRRTRSSSSCSSGPQSPITPQAPVSGAVPQTRTPALGLLPPLAPLVPRVTSKPASASHTLPSPNLSQVRETEEASEHDSSPSESASITEANPEPPSACQPFSSQECSHRKCSQSSCSCLKLEKLEQALHLLGLKPTDAQRETLRAIQTDPAGTDFKSLTRELLKLQWEESGWGQGSVCDDLTKLPESPSNPQSSLLVANDLEDMERLRKEHIESLREMKRLQEQLSQCQGLQQQMEGELNKVKQEVKSRQEESRALRSRVHLADAAQRQARGMETDYEEVVHLLEAEITELKAQRAVHPAQAKDELEELRRRVAALEGQLRRSKASRKTFEESTAKLLKFVETTQDFLMEGQGPVKSHSSGDVKAGWSRASQPALRIDHSFEDVKAGWSRASQPEISPPWTAATLAVEAKQLSRSVRASMEVDCLPVSWEEAYTAEGVKYFMNHVTKTTSWSHPVTGAEDSRESQEGAARASDPTEETT